MMANTYAGPTDRLALYEALVATNDAVERQGATMPYTSRNGHMFSFLDKSGSVALRLPDAVRQSFLEQYETTLAEQHGRVMKEYVVIPDDLLERTEELQPWFDQSYEWIGSLKPKPTTSRR
jgi:TfoX N-terminal domain